MFKWRGYVAVCAMCYLYQLKNMKVLAFFNVLHEYEGISEYL